MVASQRDGYEEGRYSTYYCTLRRGRERSLLVLRRPIRHRVQYGRRPRGMNVRQERGKWLFPFRQSWSWYTSSRTAMYAQQPRRLRALGTSRESTRGEGEKAAMCVVDLLLSRSGWAERGTSAKSYRTWPKRAVRAVASPNKLSPRLFSRRLLSPSPPFHLRTNVGDRP